MSYSFTKIKAISFWECPAYKNPEKRWFKRLRCTVVGVAKKNPGGSILEELQA
jgi:hypothetical protein